MREWTKYWLMPVSSLRSTWFSRSMIRGSPCMATSGRGDGGGTGPSVSEQAVIFEREAPGVVAARAVRRHLPGRREPHVLVAVVGLAHGRAAHLDLPPEVPPGRTD